MGSRQEKSDRSVKQELDAQDGSRARSDLSHRRKSSLGGGLVQTRSPSQTPSLTNMPIPRRRVTMNSRDAAYEEEVKAAMEASRREMMSAYSTDGNDDGPLDETDNGDVGKRESRRTKRKLDEDLAGEHLPAIKVSQFTDISGSLEPSGTPGPATSKPKHPNQYTYRPKSSSTFQNNAAASPVRRGTPVPVIAPPAQHDHGTRRAGAIATGLKEQPFVAMNVDRLNWFLPDHLSSYQELLPSSTPIGLKVRSPRTMPHISKNYYQNQDYGDWTEEHNENGNLALPDEPKAKEGLPGSMTHDELPTRIRYPARRITTTEMRRRVRHLLDWLGRVQVEEKNRAERAKLLGIDVASLPSEPIEEPDGDVVMDETFTDDVDAAPTPSSKRIVKRSFGSGPDSAQLIGELTKDILAFQEHCASVFASPFPGSTGAFSVPVTPTLPGGEVLEPSAEQSESSSTIVVNGDGKEGIDSSHESVESAERQADREAVEDQVREGEEASVSNDLPPALASGTAIEASAA
jgi:hypothetical protein